MPKSPSWNSKCAVFRDLSVAQSRQVPASIERPVVAGDKPPPLEINEETEEEFYKHCAGDVDVNVGPDLVLIQHMLAMVRDNEYQSDEEDNTDKTIVISKLNPETAPFVPGNYNNTSTPIEQPPKKEKLIKQPKKRQRNIAVESILQAIAEKENQNVLLRTPNDFITANQTRNECNIVPEEIQPFVNDKMTTTEKVNGWFETKTTSPFPKKTPKLMLEASHITFKKKDTKKGNAKKTESGKSISSTQTLSEYKPSVLAEEYYLKYVERSKFKESVKCNIWSRAEKEMKEIDDKRRAEAARAVMSPSSSTAEETDQTSEETQSTDAYTARIMAEVKISRCLDKVGLSQHRHSFTDKCIVCEVTSKKRDVPSESHINENCDSINNKIVQNNKDSNVELTQYVDSDILISNNNEDSIPKGTDTTDFMVFEKDTINKHSDDFVNENINNEELTENVEIADLIDFSTDVKNSCESISHVADMADLFSINNENPNVIVKERTAGVETANLMNNILSVDVKNSEMINKEMLNENAISINEDVNSNNIANDQVNKDTAIEQSAQKSDINDDILQNGNVEITPSCSMI